MKKTILILVALAAVVAFSSQKTALHSGSGIQYFIGLTSFDDAYNAANDGDTIYLSSGGSTPPALIAKQLHIYGAGHYPSSTTAISKSYILGNIQLDDLADNFYLEGVEINGSIYTQANESVNNITVKYCKMTQIGINGDRTFTTPSTNGTFINNVITGNIDFSNAQNFVIFNSLIQSIVSYSDENTFENNIFMARTSAYLINGNKNTIKNNIFLNNYTGINSGISNIVYNNLFVSTSQSLGTTPDYSNNYSGVQHDMIFVNQSGYIFDYSHDYHLQNPTTYLGTDGTVVGIYGGIIGYKEGAVPSNPHIEFKNISPTTTNDGMLNIELKATAQDY